jgi:hypothetical protein
MNVGTEADASGLISILRVKPLSFILFATQVNGVVPTAIDVSFVTAIVALGRLPRVKTDRCCFEVWQQWDSILEGSLDGHASRLMFASIEKESLETCIQLEVETVLKERGKKCSAKAGLHSVGSRFRAIKKKWKELGNSDLEIANMILRRVGDGGVKNKHRSKTILEVKISFRGGWGC